tara:strand:+ start:42 stop:305 length:264 start_codon:yes stop_codon:yes gene_type:complete
VGDNKKSKSAKAPYINGLKDIKLAKDGGAWLEPGIKTSLEFSMREIPKKQWEQIFGKKRIEKLNEEIEEKKKAYKKDPGKKTRRSRK